VNTPEVRALFALAAIAAVGAFAQQAGAACSSGSASPAYAARVASALASGRDVWGERLLARRNGPSVAAARSLLRPLLWARGAHGRKLTATGVYYLPFAEPDARGAGAVGLHVADGSQIISERVGGPSLNVFVGSSGTERFGSCRARAGGATLADGYLPILETGYVDGAGAHYRQESFAARVGAKLLSFVRVTADTRRAAGGVTVRFAPGARYRIPRGTVRTLFVAWPSHAVDAASYAAARQQVVDFWRGRLAGGSSISVPDGQVDDAQRALLVQDLVLTWRYSIGNPYEEFSFPESVDVAQVLAEEGFGDVAESILRVSLTRKATPYPNWKRGERLVAAAEIYRLGGDAAFIRSVTPVLRRYVSALGRQIASRPSGLLDKERYSSDIADSVYGLHSQTVVWEGLRAMAPVWDATGQSSLGATCRGLAARLERAIRAAVGASQRRLADGSLFVPISLLAGEQPYGSLTSARLGSYWNLVMPYALASGFFPSRGEQARGIFDYMQHHGSRLLGLVRAGAYALYGRDAPRSSGTDAVYGINVARFLADNDEPDQLALSLVGQLAAGMTPGTFVAGEAASVTPLPGTADRSMYLPPNGAANAAFLETLRQMLVHETRDRAGEPYGLQLAFATPRGWLLPGKRIVVRNAPTSFGPVSFSIAAAARTIAVTVTEPARARPRALALRLRLPAGSRLTGVTLDGRRYTRFDSRTGTIELPRTGGEVTLVAHRSTA
jgi:hypothetical protein